MAEAFEKASGKPVSMGKLICHYSTEIKLGNRILPQAETPIFLGATLDSHLSWKPQIESMRKRGIQKLALLKWLSGTHWGNTLILKTGYTGTVRPTLEYTASAWATAAKTLTNKLDQVPNMGLRTTLDAMKSTPIATIQKTAGVEPLDFQRNAKLLKHGEKV